LKASDDLLRFPEFSGTYAGAGFSLMLPGLRSFHNFIPERIGPALRWPKFVDGANPLLKEDAVISRFFIEAETRSVPDVHATAICRREGIQVQAKAIRQPRDIVLAEPD
jgi:hypothetical protein